MRIDTWIQLALARIAILAQRFERSNEAKGLKLGTDTHFETEMHVLRPANRVQDCLLCLSRLDNAVTEFLIKVNLEFELLFSDQGHKPRLHLEDSSQT